MIVKLDVCVMLTRDADTLLKGIQARHTGILTPKRTPKRGRIWPEFRPINTNLYFLSERDVALHLARVRVDHFVREAGHILGVHPLQGVALAQADQGLVFGL